MKAGERRSERPCLSMRGGAVGIVGTQPETGSRTIGEMRAVGISVGESPVWLGMRGVDHGTSLGEGSCHSD